MSRQVIAALAIQIGSWLIWLPLKVLAINAILKAGVRRYPLFFFYMVVTFLFTAIQAPLSIAFTRSDAHAGPWLRRLNDWGGGTTYALILVVVLNLIYRATAKMGARRLVRIVLTAAGLLVAGISLSAHYDGSVPSGVWMTPWTRDLHFCAAILDLALWGILVSSRDRDPRLLLLTGGMGIMFAGEAIGAAIRTLAIPSKSLILFYGGHVFQVLTSALFLYVWWQTFRKEADVGKWEGRAAPKAGSGR